MTWAVREKGYSQRHACRLVGLHPKTYRYVTKRSGDEALRRRLHELASQRRRFGYTSSYSAFLARLDEVELLVRFAAQKERVDAVTMRAEINALCRGAVILLSSHVEANVKELAK